MANQRDEWWDTHDETYAEKQAAGHEFAAGKLTPAWCTRCGCSAEIHGSGAYLCPHDPECGDVCHAPQWEHA